MFALLVLLEHRREFELGMHVAYIDLKKFKSVSLWEAAELLRLRGILAMSVVLQNGLYYGTENALKFGASSSVQLLSRKYESEAGMRLTSVTFNSCTD